MRNVWLVLLLLPLAGCLQDPAGHGSPTGATVELAPGGMYGFTHPAGALRLAAPSGADLELYNAFEERVGRFSLHAGQDVEVGGMPAGESVLRIHSLNESVHVTVNGKSIDSFRALSVHVERHVLVNREQPLVPVGLMQQPLPRTELAVQLERAPIDLRVLASSDYQDLSIQVTNAGGLLLDGTDSAIPFLVLGPTELVEVSLEFFPANVQAGALAVTLEASHAAGALVLESTSFSRFAAPEPLPQAKQLAARFSYGEIPDRPASFQVAADATVLSFIASQEGELQLWSPSDAFLGVYPMQPAQPLSIRVSQGGYYVAHTTAGLVSATSDAIPADFEFHPLEVDSQIWTNEPGARNYTVREVTSELSGTPFHFQRYSEGFFGCSQHAFVRLSYQNETMAAWNEGQSGSILLEQAPDTIRFESVGSNDCVHLGAVMDAWRRPV